MSWLKRLLGEILVACGYKTTVDTVDSQKTEGERRQLAFGKSVLKRTEFADDLRVCGDARYVYFLSTRPRDNLHRAVFVKVSLARISEACQSKYAMRKLPKLVARTVRRVDMMFKEKE